MGSLRQFGSLVNFRETNENLTFLNIEFEDWDPAVKLVASQWILRCALTPTLELENAGRAMPLRAHPTVTSTRRIAPRHVLDTPLSPLNPSFILSFFFFFFFFFKLNALPYCLFLSLFFFKFLHSLQFAIWREQLYLFIFIRIV